MNLLFPSITSSRGRLPTNIFSASEWIGTAESNRIYKIATDLTSRIFGQTRDLDICIETQSIYRLSKANSLSLCLHPLLVFDFSSFDEKLLSENTSDLKAELWVLDRFEKGFDIPQRPFSTTLKIVRALAPSGSKTYEGFRSFVLARDIAALKVSGHWETSPFYTDLGYQSRSSSVIFKVISVFACGLPVMAFISTGSALLATATALGALAAKAFTNYRNGRTEKQCLITALKATGDIKSARNYYKLIRHYMPRRFDWIRRNTIDRLMQVHDPLKTLDSLSTR